MRCNGPPGDVMDKLIRAAGWAAWLIFAAFAVHNLNGVWTEPVYLGFRSYGDYADLAKLTRASQSLPWLLSGIGHLGSGFAMVILATGAFTLFRSRTPASALIMLGAGLLAAGGFLLLGLSHVIGRQALSMLSAANPALQDAAYLTATLARIYFNALAQVALGWFAVQLSWSGLATGMLPKTFAWYGFLSGAAGLLMAFVYAPIYLLTVLIWAPWLGLVLLRRPPDGAVPGQALADNSSRL